MDFTRAAELSSRLNADDQAVLKELTDEVMRLESRADHARTKADELVGWLNGRWG